MAYKYFRFTETDEVMGLVVHYMDAPEARIFADCHFITSTPVARANAARYLEIYHRSALRDYEEYRKALAMEDQSRIGRAPGTNVYDGQGWCLDSLGGQVMHGSTRVFVNRELPDPADNVIYFPDESFIGLFEHSAFAVAVSCMHTNRIVAINHKGCDVLGYEASDLVGRTALERDIFVNPEERAEILYETCMNGYSRGRPVHLLSKQGRVITGIMTTQVVRTPGNEFVLTTFRDMTPDYEMSARLRILGHAFKDIVFTLDANLDIVYVNAEAKRHYGTQLVGRCLTSMVVPEDQERVLAYFLELASTDVYNSEGIVFKSVVQDGTTRSLEALVANLSNIPRIRGLLVLCRDVTQREQENLIIQKLNERNAAMVSLLDTGYWEARPGIDELFLNNRAMDIMKWDAGFLTSLGMPVIKSLPCGGILLNLSSFVSGVKDVIHPGDHWIFSDRRLLTQGGPIPLSPIVDDQAFRVLRSDGTYVPLRIRFKIMASGSNGGIVLGTLTDLSQDIENLEIRASLERHVLEVEDHTRQEIAIRLHDELGSYLTEIKHMTTFAMRRGNSGFVKRLVNLCLRPWRITKELKDILIMISNAHAHCRRIASQLHPQWLDSSDDREMFLTIRDLVSRCGREIDFCLDVAIKYPLPSELRLQVYYIAYEAVINAIKHSRCRAIAVSLVQHDDHYVLGVRDDGQGFNHERRSIYLQTKSMGLKIMHYRAELVGGRLSVTSMPGEGTVIQCYIPRGKQ